MSDTEREEPMKLADWLRERLDNSRRLARIKRGLDRAGWEEDANYFEQALAVVEAARQRPAASVDKKLWLWKNFVEGRPEYWAFDNPYPTNLDNADPQTLGEPCGWAIFKPSRDGSCGRTEESVTATILRMQREKEAVASPPARVEAAQEVQPTPVIGYHDPASDSFMHASTYAKLSDEARKGFRPLIYAAAVSAPVVMPDKARAGIEVLHNVIECLLTTSRYVDEEGEATQALTDLLSCIADPPFKLKDSSAAPSNGAGVQPSQATNFTGLSCMACKKPYQPPMTGCVGSIAAYACECGSTSFLGTAGVEEPRKRARSVKLKCQYAEPPAAGVKALPCTYPNCRCRVSTAGPECERGSAGNAGVQSCARCGGAGTIVTHGGGEQHPCPACGSAADAGVQMADRRPT